MANRRQYGAALAILGIGFLCGSPAVFVDVVPSDTSPEAQRAAIVRARELRLRTSYGLALTGGLLLLSAAWLLVRSSHAAAPHGLWAGGMGPRPRDGD